MSRASDQLDLGPPTVEGSDTREQDSGASSGVPAGTAPADPPKDARARQPNPAQPAASALDLSEERALFEQAKAALDSSDYGGARERARAAIDGLLERPEAEREAAWLDLLDRAGHVAWSAQDARAANRAWSVVLEVRSRTLPEEHRYLQQARLNLASTLITLGDLAAARVLEEEALEGFSRTLPEEHPDLQTARQNLATTLRDLGDLQGARALEEKVLEIRSRTLPEEHPDLQAARGNLALTMRALGDLEGARALEEQVLEIRSRTLPDEHPDLQKARQNLATTLRDLGDLQGARALQELVLEVRSRTLPDEHPHLQWARKELAVTMIELGDLQGARVLQEKVLEVHARTLPDDHPSLQAARGNLVTTLEALGDLQGVKTHQEKVLEVRARTLPDDHRNLLAARQNLARTLYLLGDLEGARVLLEIVYEVRSRALPDEHPDLLVARKNLVLTMKALRDFQGARVLQEQVLDVLTRTLPNDHPDLQAARHGLAITIMELGDLQGARALLEQVLESFSRTLLDEDPQVQVVRANLAVTMRGLGELESARTLEERVLEVLSRTLSDEHPDLLAARQNLAITLRELGDLQSARTLEEQVLEVRSRTLPDEHSDLIAARWNLAITLRELGDPQGARDLQEKVLEVRSRTMASEHPDLQEVRASLATTLKALGDFQRARTLEEQVLEVLSRTLPDEHLDLQDARGNLAVTLKALGDFQRARTLEERVLEVRSCSLPDEHPYLQIARGNLATTIRELGDPQGARELQEKVLEVRSRTLPDEHPDLLAARQNLAITISELGDLQGGRALFEKVLEVRLRALPDEHPDLQRARGNLALPIKALGDLEAARMLEEKVLEVRSRTLPDEHPDLQRARENLAVTIAMEHVGPPIGEPAQSGERERARARCVELLGARCASERRAARRLLLQAAPREAEERCSSLAEGLGVALSFAGGMGAFPASTELDLPCFALSETTRGAALASASLMRLAAGFSDYAKLRDRLASSSRALADSVAQDTTSEEFRTAREQREALERELVALGNRLGGSELAEVELDVLALAATLREHDAIVAYRRFVRTRISASVVQDGIVPAAPVETREASLCAFVLRGGAQVDLPGTNSQGNRPDLEFVELGPIAPIDDAVRAWRAGLGSAAGRGVSVAASESSTDLAVLGARVRELVFDPLRDVLDGAERVVLVLDDVLHLVPFDVLPSGDGERELLGDRLRIETRATVTELLSSVPPTQGGACLLALGGVDFEGVGVHSEVLAATAGLENEGPAIETGAACELPAFLRGAGFAGFAPLPATEGEVEALAAIFVAQEDSGALSVLVGGAATRERLIESAPRAHWLHVATHGWYASESIRSWADPEPLDRQTGLGLRLSGEEQVKGMSPMLLCGLALAGANLPPDSLGRVSGLITAEELSTLDLTGCELAVLSACDTNVGERRAGQGVASLQKALHMAGARSVVTSLWKVPDEATRELMLDFYRRLWVEEKPKHRALWEAKMRLREAKDKHGNPRYTTRDWAAWVLTGEPD